MQDPTRELMDESWALAHELDDGTPLWTADVEQVERWPRTSREASQDARDRLLTQAGRVEAVADGAAVADAAALLTAGAALRSVAGQHAIAPLALSSPTGGLHGFLHWAVPAFALVTAEHGDQYVAKVAGLDRALDELAQRLRQDAADDLAPLARHATATADAVDRHLELAVEDDPLLSQPAPTRTTGAEAARWRQTLAAAVRERVRPGLRRYRDALREVAPAGRDDDRAGLVHRPGGDAQYAELLQSFTEPGTTPEQVHETGLAQLARLDEEWSRLGASVLGTDDPAAVRRAMREDASLRYGSAEELVAAATELHARAEAAAPVAFRTVPSAPCAVRATRHGSQAFYSPPTADGSRGGTFYFNVADPTVWGLELATTVFHEGIPGHHFQGALAVENPDLHPLQREVFLSAYGEGWALYAERLADEIGLFHDDRERLGMLTGDAMRASRMVVDTGLHHLGWSRQRAIDTMLDQTPLARGTVEAEVDRYIAHPGQAVSYMTGRLAIQQARADASARLGDRFDLPQFHDVVLSQGMMSLPALRLVTDGWDGGWDA